MFAECGTLGKAADVQIRVFQRFFAKFGKNVVRIIDKYLFREAALAWLGVTSVLLAIILAHRFSRFLGEAAAGLLPPGAVFELLGYAGIGFLSILVPVGLFLGLLSAFGRIYHDSEMAALFACGVGPRQLYRPVAALALVGFLLVIGLSLFAAPWSAKEALKSRRTAEKEAEVGMFDSGRFKTSKDGAVAFYAQSVDAETGELNQVFVHQAVESGADVTVRGNEGMQRLDASTGQRFLVLKEGVRVEGVPGEADYRVVEFAEHGIEIRRDDPDLTTSKRDGISTIELWQSDLPADQAELQWRLSMPLLILVLAFFSVPLSRTAPREGRYGKIVYGLLIYVVYSNLLGIAQAWLENGYIPIWLGLWWVHLVMLAIASYLLARMNGWRGILRR